MPLPLCPYDSTPCPHGNYRYCRSIIGGREWCKEVKRINGETVRRAKEISTHENE